MRLAYLLGSANGQADEWCTRYLQEPGTVAPERARTSAITIVGQLRQLALALGDAGVSVPSELQKGLDRLASHMPKTVATIEKRLSPLVAQLRSFGSSLWEHRPANLSQTSPREEQRLRIPKNGPSYSVPATVIMMDIYQSESHRVRIAPSYGDDKWPSLADEMFRRVWACSQHNEQLFYGFEKGDLEAWILVGDESLSVSRAMSLGLNAMTEAQRFSCEFEDFFRLDDGRFCPIALKVLVGTGTITVLQNGKIRGAVLNHLSWLEESRFHCRPSAILLTDGTYQNLESRLRQTTCPFVPFNHEKLENPPLPLWIIPANMGFDRRKEQRCLPIEKVSVRVTSNRERYEYSLYDEGTSGLSLFTEKVGSRRITVDTKVNLSSNSWKAKGRVLWTARGGQLLGIRKDTAGSTLLRSTENPS